MLHTHVSWGTHMKRFKNILMIAEDRQNDRKSLRRAVELAERNNARLNILEVIEIPEKQISRLNKKLKGKNLRERFINERRTALDVLLRQEKAAPERVDIAFGIPFLKIIQNVQKYKFDLVIKVAEGKCGLKEKLFGTTSLHLMRKCPCPTWILKPGKIKGYKKILAAVDPMDPDPVKDSLNKKIMELATSMAEIEHAELHVVHNWQFLEESLLINRIGLDRHEVKALANQEKELHQQALDSLVRRHPTEAPRILRLLKGNPGEIIPKYTEEYGIDLVVMGTLSRHGVAGLLIGNTAEQVIQRVNVAVLTVKPEGFVTPVR